MSRQRKVIHLVYASSVFIAMGAVCAAEAAAAQLIVDSSTGTVEFGDSCPDTADSAVYSSLQAAIDCAASGDVIEVSDGVYGVAGLTNRGGFATAILIDGLSDLTIRAAPGHEPRIAPNATAEADIVSLSIQDVVGLVIDNIDSDQTVVQFDNWHVFDSEDLTVRNSTFTGGEDGIDFETGHTKAVIENNEFNQINSSNGDEALEFKDGSFVDILIQDNVFSKNVRHIRVGPLADGDIATGITIRRNVLAGTTSQEAVRLIDADTVVMENNAIFNNSQQGVYIDAGSENISLLHNTFFNNGEEEIRTKQAGTDILIANNIIFANGVSAAISADVESLPGEDFNLIFNNGSETESSQAPVTVFGPHTITEQDPLFVSTTPGVEDLRLTADSPAIEAGAELGVIDDIEQNSRPNPVGTAPDLGAYEFADTGTITIVKVADPPDGTDFTFAGDLGAFALDDATPDDCDDVGNTITFPDLPAGTYTVAEVVPADWTLESIQCETSDADDTTSVVDSAVAIDLDPGEEIVCVFTNVHVPPVCQVDADDDVDFIDLLLILFAHGHPAAGPHDPRDPNRDGIITGEDVSICASMCSNVCCKL